MELNNQESSLERPQEDTRVPITKDNRSQLTQPDQNTNDFNDSTDAEVEALMKKDGVQNETEKKEGDKPETEDEQVEKLMKKDENGETEDTEEIDLGESFEDLPEEVGDLAVKLDKEEDREALADAIHDIKEDYEEQLTQEKEFTDQLSKYADVAEPYINTVAELEESIPEFKALSTEERTTKIDESMRFMVAFEKNPAVTLMTMLMKHSLDLGHGQNDLLQEFQRLLTAPDKDENGNFTQAAQTRWALMEQAGKYVNDMALTSKANKIANQKVSAFKSETQQQQFASDPTWGEAYTAVLQKPEAKTMFLDKLKMYKGQGYEGQALRVEALKDTLLRFGVTLDQLDEIENPQTVSKTNTKRRRTIQNKGRQSSFDRQAKAAADEDKEIEALMSADGV